MILLGKPAPAASSFSEQSVIYYKYIGYYASVLHWCINTLFRPPLDTLHEVCLCLCGIATECVGEDDMNCLFVFTFASLYCNVYALYILTTHTQV